MVGLEIKLPLLLAAALARAVGGAIPDLLLLHDGVTSPLWEVLHLWAERSWKSSQISLGVHGDTVTERGGHVFMCLE